MSCSLIEAKFQMLDRTIKELSNPKNLHAPTITSSEQLRELMEAQRPTSLLSTIKSGIAMTRSNQVHSKINTAGRVQPNTAREEKREKKKERLRPSTATKDRHKSSTDSFSVQWMNPKQQRAEQTLQRAWDAESRSKLSGKSTQKSKEPFQDLCDDQIHDDKVCNASSLPKRPSMSAGLQAKRSNAYLSTRCRSASSSNSNVQGKNWFASPAVRMNATSGHGPKSKCKSRSTPQQKFVKQSSPPCPEGGITRRMNESEPTRKTSKTEVVNEPEKPSRVLAKELEKPCCVPVNIPEDPSFYMLELCLEHAEVLTEWRFQASFTDVSASPPMTVILEGLTVDSNNCLLFDDPQSAQHPAPSRCFNPFLYFPGLSRPSDLYRHVLRIVVTSIQPVVRVVINTSVQFTRFPDEPVVQLPSEPIRPHLVSHDATFLQAKPRRCKSASTSSRKRTTSLLAPRGITGLVMNHPNPWTSEKQDDLDTDVPSAMLGHMLALQLGKTRPLSSHATALGHH